jgi:hypothetical protein
MLGLATVGAGTGTAVYRQRLDAGLFGQFRNRQGITVG